MTDICRQPTKFNMLPITCFRSDEYATIMACLPGDGRCPGFVIIIICSLYRRHELCYLIYLYMPCNCCITATCVQFCTWALRFSGFFGRFNICWCVLTPEAYLKLQISCPTRESAVQYFHVNKMTSDVNLPSVKLRLCKMGCARSFSPFRHFFSSNKLKQD
jgi:hypothetical protein